MTPEQRAAARERIANANEDYMQSACGEYHCDCHRDLPAALDEIDQLEKRVAELEAEIDAREAVEQEHERSIHYPHLKGRS